jgi:nucleoside-diphosphate-sugar epimerase
MKSLVTGGAGFIGSNLVDSLIQLGLEKITLLMKSQMQFLIIR